MDNENSVISKNRCRSIHHHHGSSGDAVYGLGMIGAAVFYISQATTFWMGALGLLKAFVWPAFLVYEALSALL